MQFRLSSILFFLIFLSLSIHSNLSAQTWESLLDSSDYYFDTDQKRSLMYLQDAYSALSAENAGKPNGQEAVLLNNLGMLYWDVDDLGNSKKYLLKSVETWRKIGQTSNEDYANALTNAANVSKILGDFGAAERFYKELLEVIGKTKGDRSTDYIKSMQELGSFYEHIGELEMAAVNFEKAHTLIEQNHSTVMFLMANSYSDLGRIYIKLGQPDKAFSFIQHSDELYEANSLTHKLEYLENLEHLGIVYEYLGKYGESERVLLKTLDLKKKLEGIDQGLILKH